MSGAHVYRHRRGRHQPEGRSHGWGRPPAGGGAHRPLDFRGAEAFAADLAAWPRRCARPPADPGRRWLRWDRAAGGRLRRRESSTPPTSPWHMCPWRSCFRRHLDVPVLLGNDADCAAVGEYLRGAGRGCRDFAVVTLGTGVGAGIILDGRLRGGAASSEAGHMVTPCRRRALPLRPPGLLGAVCLRPGADPADQGCHGGPPGEPAPPSGGGAGDRGRPDALPGGGGRGRDGPGRVPGLCGGSGGGDRQPRQSPPAGGGGRRRRRGRRAGGAAAGAPAGAGRSA